MDQAPHNESFIHPVCAQRSMSTLAENTALVSDRLVQGKVPVARAPSSKQIVVTMSQESAARLCAALNSRVPTRMARFVWWMPSAIGHLSGGCAARSRQMLVTLSRVLPPYQGLGLNGAEIERTPDVREVGLVAALA